ncbi:MAG: hypothetical protein QM771_20395 [Nitrospira sp.]
MAYVKGLSGFVIAAVACGALAIGTAGLSVADDGGKGTHRHYKGEVIEKAGNWAIKDETGSTYSLSENEAQRQGRQFKAGDKVEFIVNENNTLIDVHLVGEKHKHKHVTGKLVHVGLMKKEIKLQTADGEKTFPLLLQETKTKALAEGAEVTVELNEAGTVIDLHEGKHKK